MATKLESGVDQHWLLLERQINAAGNETFSHIIRQPLTQSGVQNGANLVMDFNPNYQSLILHWARIWRGADYLNRLDTNKVKVIHQERDLDQYLLNGQQSAVLVMDDVRVGDIIDYAYSIKGANPIFHGLFSSAVQIQLEQPVEHLTTRVLWPSNRRLYAKTHSCSVQPSVSAKKGLTEYLWDAKQMPGFHVEDSLPIWCDPQPWVQLGEYQSWAEVNQWAMVLFEVEATPSPELAAKVTGWKKIIGREQQILAVLRFVQDEVRYFGIEIGVNAEQPSEPAVVFSRRFGDCKDKSLLFVTILRALGIEAYPVLVNTQYGHALDEWQPSPNAFDHCIAQVKCEGQTYWVDPTAGYQRGSLATHYLPNYERGLVVASRTASLTVIPQTGSAQTTTTEYFQLGNRMESSSLKVVTIAEGRDADNLRALFATTKRSDIEKNYTHFYSDLYPGVKMSSPIIITDDEQENRIQTTESYAIDKIWVQSNKDGSYHCQFFPTAIAAFLKRPVDVERKMPVSVSFPKHEILRTEITLPGAWSVNNEKEAISDPAFFFQKNVRSTGNKLVLEYEYRSFVDSVPSGRTREYFQRLNQISQILGNTLTWR